MATEKSLIDANKLTRDLKGIKDMLVAAGDPFLASVINRAIGCVENQPSVDAVEVVRCKECRYRSQYSDENGMYHCGGIDTTKDHALPIVAPDDFCSYGERRDDGQPYP